MMWAGGGFLLVGIVCAGLYGVYVDRERDLSPACREYAWNHAERIAYVPPMAQRVNLDSCPEQIRFLENTFLFSVWLAAALLAGGTMAEWHRTRMIP
jgi:hypothetical protein